MNRMQETIVTSLAAAVEKLRCDQFTHPFIRKNQHSSYKEVLCEINRVAEENTQGHLLGFCGTASALALDYLPSCLDDGRIDILVATASAANGCFHNYPLVFDRETKNIVVCDLSASQYFSRPRDAFNGKPYFIGERARLKEIVMQARVNSWTLTQERFPDFGFQDIEAFDIAIRSDFGLAKDFSKAVRRYSKNCLMTEQLSCGWEQTWGDQSRPVIHGTGRVDGTAQAVRLVEIWDTPELVAAPTDKIGLVKRLYETPSLRK